MLVACTATLLEELLLSAGLPADPLFLIAAGLLAAGALSAAFADKVRVPGLLIFLGLGMLFGDDGLNLISLSDPRVAQTFGVLALVVILFQGGLTTKPGDLRRVALPGLALATFGVVITAGVVAGGALLLADVDFFTAALIGAVVSSTDAAAVFGLLRKAPLPRRFTSLLEVESGANDPMAVLLTVALLEAWSSTISVAGWVVFGLLQLVGGVLIGALIGWSGSWLLRRVRLGAAGLYPVLALAVAGLAYGTGAVVGASGFLAVYAAGLIVGAQVPRHRRGIREFHDVLANTAEIGLFLLLGLLVFPSQLPPVIFTGLAISAVLVFLARPVAVFAILGVPLLRGRWRLPELALVSWTGLRGAVPIVLATFPLTVGYPQGSVIFNTVFFVVLVSSAMQGSTVGFLANRLGLREDARVWGPIAEALPLEGMAADLVEVDITEDLPIAGRRLRDVPPPEGALLTAHVRGPTTTVPTGDTVLQAGDHVLVAVSRRPTATEEIVAWARGEVVSVRRPVAKPVGEQGAEPEGEHTSARTT